jgi:hypothetical protein
MTEGMEVTTILTPQPIVGNEFVGRMLKYADEFDALADVVKSVYGYNMYSMMQQVAHTCRSAAGQGLKLPVPGVAAF